MKKRVSILIILIFAIITAFCFDKQNVANKTVIDNNKQFRCDTLDCGLKYWTEILPKVSIDSFLIISQQELLMLKYNTSDTIVNVQTIVVSSNNVLKKNINLLHNNKFDTLNITCSYFIIMNSDSITQKANGIILLPKNANYEENLFSEPQTMTESILSPDAEVGECGIQKITTKLTYNTTKNSHIKFVQYLPISKDCIIDLINYDEFITLSKEAFMLCNNKEYKTGLIWNSPEGFAGY